MFRSVLQCDCICPASGAADPGGAQGCVDTVPRVHMTLFILRLALVGSVLQCDCICPASGAADPGGAQGCVDTVPRVHMTLFILRLALVGRR